MYHQNSYKKHEEWYNNHFPTVEAKEDFYKENANNESTLNSWLQNILFSCLDPLVKKSSQHWLTIGDAYGFDAQYLMGKNLQQVEATDLNGDFLEIARQKGVIENYSSQNAENLTYPDDSFDYVLCKETYHHFPRPYAALYEMIRVAKKGMVIIEPQDPITKMPYLLGLLNLIGKFNPALINKVWKNQFSYEPVGNFIYKVSEREFAKFAAGLNLPCVAFKQINPNFYSKKIIGLSASKSEKEFRKIRFKKFLLDTLVKFSIIPGQVLAVIVFKEQPDAEVLNELKNSNYKVIDIPKNPYI